MSLRFGVLVLLGIKDTGRRLLRFCCSVATDLPLGNDHLGDSPGRALVVSREE